MDSVDRWIISQKTKRFGELKREISGISQKMLTQTLRGMERDGLINRKVYPTVPPKVEYSLTELGVTLVNMLNEICDWSENNIEQVMQAQKKYDAINSVND